MAKRRTDIARIGVTGGIGSGKSAVCAIFERLGIPVLYADAIAREISNSDPVVKKKIAALFGPQAYRNDRALHRQYIASVVFSDKRLQRRLNAVIHPEVERELEKRIRHLSANAPFVVVEAALIYEAGLVDMLDAVVVVDAEEKVRIQRVVKRDSLPADDVRKRANAQWSQSKKRSRADFVIQNNGSFVDLDTQVRFLYHLFVQRYGKA